MFKDMFRYIKSLILPSLDDRFEKYNGLVKERNQVRQELDVMTNDYNQKIDIFKSLRTELDGELLLKLDEKVDGLKKEHLQTSSKLIAKSIGYEKHIERCLQNEDLLKAIDIYNYSIIKGKFKSREVNSGIFDMLIKARQGVVKYSDFILNNEKGEILLLKRSGLVDFEPNKWCLPGGHVDPGEDFKIASQRELLEETGVKVESCLKVGEYHSAADGVEIEYYEGILKDNSQEVVLMADEHTEFKWVMRNDLIKYDLIKNLRENLNKIYPFLNYTGAVVINKALEAGIIDSSIFEKGRSHKYIRKELKEGRWSYIYEEDEVENIKKEEIFGLKKKVNILKENLRVKKTEYLLFSNKLKEDFKSSKLRGSELNESNIIFKVSLTRFLNESKDLQLISEDIRALNSNIYQIEQKINYDRIPQGEINILIYTAIKGYENFIRENPFLVAFREKESKVSKDDYYIGTDTVFKKLKYDESSYKTIDEEWSRIKNLGDFQLSPKSSSQYVVTNEGVYRYADHWGRCASCYWELEGESADNRFEIGYSKFNEFKVNGLNGGYYIVNPTFLEKAPDLIKESLYNIGLIRKSFKLNKTEEKKLFSREEELNSYLLKINTEKEGGYERKRKNAERLEGEDRDNKEKVPEDFSSLKMSIDEDIEKRIPHKYIDKIKDNKGKDRYIYKEAKIKEQIPEGIVNAEELVNRYLSNLEKDIEELFKKSSSIRKVEHKDGKINVSYTPQALKTLKSQNKDKNVGELFNTEIGEHIDNIILTDDRDNYSPVKVVIKDGKMTAYPVKWNAANEGYDINLNNIPITSIKNLYFKPEYFDIEKEKFVKQYKRKVWKDVQDDIVNQVENNYKDSGIEHIEQSTINSTIGREVKRVIEYIKENKVQKTIDEREFYKRNQYKIGVELVPINEVERFKEFDRETQPKWGEGDPSLNELYEKIKKEGIKEPIRLEVREGKALILEGNTRLAVAKKLGLRYIPLKIEESIRSWTGTVYEDKAKEIDKGNRQYNLAMQKQRYEGKPIFGTPLEYGFTSILPNNIDKSIDSDIEKGKPAQVGEEREWGGVKYKKTAQGWLPVKGDKKNKQDEEKESKPDKKTEEESGKSGEEKPIEDHAKESSEIALNNAIKNATDPEVREAAHQELDRREKEEQVQEEGKQEKKKEPVKEKKVSEKKDIVFKSKKDKKAKEYYQSQNIDLDFEDYILVSDYKFRAYEDINDSLRKNKESDDKEKINRLSNLINKNKIKDNITLYRKVRSLDFLKDLNEGDIYEEKSFSSVSLVSDFDDNNFFGDNLIEIFCFKNSSVMCMNEPNLLEYVIDKDSKFRIIKKDDKNIFLELIDEKEGEYERKRKRWKN